MFFSRPAGNKWIDRGSIESFDYILGDFIVDGEVHEKDLSAKIGTGVKLLNIILGVSNETMLRGMFLFTNGLGLQKNFGGVNSFPDGSYNEHAVWVLTDKNGKIQYMCQAGTWTVIQFTIRGWFEK